MFNISEWFKRYPTPVSKHESDSDSLIESAIDSGERFDSELEPPRLQNSIPTDPSEVEASIYENRPLVNEGYYIPPKYESCCTPSNIWSLIKLYVPQYISIFSWVPNYSKKDLPFDLISGLTVGIMVIPQAMSYAILAGLPPQYGLYTAFVPTISYALLGHSKQMNVGPDPLGSLLLSTSIPTGVDPVEAATIIAFLCGLFHCFFGLFHFGFLDNIVSVAVLRGYISAVAVQIGVKQLDGLMGVPGTTATGWARIEYLFQSIPDINWIAFTLGIGSLLFLIILRTLKKKFPQFIILKLIPGVLIAVGMAMLLAWAFDLEEKGVPLLPKIENGYPAPVPPKLNDIELVSTLVPSGLYMSIVGMVGSLVVVRQFSSIFRYSCDPNKELLALGTGNVIGSFFNCFPAFGALGRSQVAAMSGAKTQLVGLITAVIVIITLLFFVQIFAYLPISIPAAIILDAAISLIDIEDIIFLFKIRAFFDLALMTAIFVITVALGSQVGVLLALSASILLVVRHSTVPHISVLGRIPNTDKYKDVRIFPEAEVTPGVLIIRVEETLYFGNIQQVKAMLMQIEKVGFGQGLKQSQQFLSIPLQAVVIDAAYIPKLDSTAIKAVKTMVEMYQKRGIQVCFVKLDDANKMSFVRSGIIDLIGTEALFSEVAIAADSVEGRGKVNYSYSTYRNLE